MYIRIKKLGNSFNFKSHQEKCSIPELSTISAENRKFRKRITATKLQAWRTTFVGFLDFPFLSSIIQSSISIYIRCIHCCSISGHTWCRCYFLSISCLAVGRVELLVWEKLKVPENNDLRCAPICWTPFSASVDKSSELLVFLKSWIQLKKNEKAEELLLPISQHLCYVIICWKWS